MKQEEDDDYNQFLENLRQGEDIGLIETQKRGRKKSKLESMSKLLPKSYRSKSPKNNICFGLEKSTLGRYMLMSNLMRNSNKKVCSVYPKLESILEILKLTELLFENDTGQPRGNYLFDLINKELKTYEISYYEPVQQPEQEQTVIQPMEIDQEMQLEKEQETAQETAQETELEKALGLESETLSTFKFPSSTIRNCMNRPDVEFILIPLIIYYPSGSSHMNMIVMSKENDIWTAERFEPSTYYQNDSMDDILAFYFYELGVDYIQPSDFLNPVGIQEIVEKSSNFFDLNGFCVMWSFIYATERMKSNKNRTKVASELLDRLTSRARSLFLPKIINKELKMKDLNQYPYDILVYYVIDRIIHSLFQESEIIDKINQNLQTQYQLENRSLKLFSSN
jgi:hypothetical protein